MWLEGRSFVFCCLSFLSSLSSLSSFLAFCLDTALLFVRGVLSLAAPALVLLLFAFPPADPVDFLTSAPIVFAVLLLALAALVDFCTDLWRLQTAQQEERRLLPSMFRSLTPVAERLIRLERSARWRLFRRRGEWLFVPLWMAAMWWIHNEAALPVMAGAVLGLSLLLFFGALARIDSESRERRIADTAMRAAASLGLARLLGRFAAFAERSLVRHNTARRAERSLAVLSAACLLCLRLSAAATLVLFLLHALSLVGGGQASLGELVAILLLLRTLFFWLEQRSRALCFYAPQERPVLTLASATQAQPDKEGGAENAKSAESAESAEGASAPILQVLQGEIPPMLVCDDLVLQQGEAIALAGESASGKSLLLQACAGLAESKGFFLSGKPVDASALSSALFCVSYVPQEAALLDGSLGENIAAFRSPCNEARAKELLVLLGAERTLARLPDGLATRTNPFDARLPYAFKVQVLLAAALYFEPRLLLCDACLDAMDSKGIERFARVLQNFCRKGAAVLATRQSALLQVCSKAWICAHNRVQVRELEVR